MGYISEPRELLSQRIPKKRKWTTGLGADLADSNNLIPTLEILFQKDYNDEYTVYDHEKDIQQLIQRLHGRGFNLYASFR